MSWTRAAIEALGPVTDVPTTASVIGVNPETIYGAIRRGEWTHTRVLRLGRKIRIPTHDLVSLLYPGTGEPTAPTRSADTRTAEAVQLRAIQDAS
ncbi:DNA-binding protein [Streptomyces sp. NPDC006784]|uniref:DNA-binding protein n=1 Tax=Streptomyces sp. NPDC006784 TaxID=3364764 RepID=UPI0036BF63ED